MTLQELKSRVEAILATATPCLVFSTFAHNHGVVVEWVRAEEAATWDGLKPGICLSTEFSDEELEHRLEGLRLVSIRK